MHTAKKTEITSPVLTLGGTGRMVMVGSFVIGLIGLGAAAALSAGDWKQFSFSYLVSFSFLVSISVGALFFVTILHLTRAGWAVVLRRLAEILANSIFPMLVLFLPILLPVLFKSGIVFEWNDEAVVAGNTLLQGKVNYLNAGFFGIRCVFVFAVWGFMARYFFSRSLKQDETGDKKLTLSMQAFSAPMMILFAITISIAAFDWQMSLEPEWFSTMFPVYFFAGSVLSCLATLILFAFLLQSSGRVTEDITIEHYHDLAKLTFAFVFFWGYIAFSQYLLIWYANIPEETFWFLKRQEGGWWVVSLILVFGHLIVPFLGIMARTVRRNKVYLCGAAIYLLVMHWIDHYWLIMPKLNPEFSMSIVDICCLIGLGGLYVAIVCWIAANRPLIPLKDPRLIESLNFKNP